MSHPNLFLSFAPLILTANAD